MEENNTGGWCTPSYTEVGWPQLKIEFPQVSIERDGVTYPMPQLDTTIIRILPHWWSRGGWYAVVRQYGQDKHVKVGPFASKARAREMERELYAWYTSVYNVIIRTHKARERNKK